MHRVWDLQVVRYVRGCAELFVTKRILQHAAAMAYFLLLTVFPLIICVHAFLGVLNLDAFRAVFYLEGILPEATINLISGYLSYLSIQDSTAMLFAGGILGVTAASAAYRALARMLVDIYETRPVGGVQRWVQSILFPVALVLMVYLAVGVVITGDWLLGTLSQVLQWQKVLGLWRYLRFLLLFLVFFLFVVGVSLSALPRGTARIPVLAGSMLSSLLLVSVSVLFSMFISMSTRYSLVYGSLMSIVVLLIWLYLCSNILLMGNVLSSVWYRQYGGKTECKGAAEKAQEKSE